MSVDAYARALAGTAIARIAALADVGTPVTLVAGAYTTLVSDNGKMLDVTTGASDATITLVGAAAAGPDAIVGIRKVDSGAGRVIIKSSGVIVGFLARQWEWSAPRVNEAATLWTPSVLRANAGVLAQSAVAVALTGSDAAEHALATINIPAGLMGVNDAITVDAMWTVTNNANVKTARVRLGGIGGTSFHTLVLTSTLTGRTFVRFSNRGVANSQVAFAGSSGSGTSSAAMNTGAVDTTASQDLVITAQDAGSLNQVTLEAYRVELQAI